MATKKTSKKKPMTKAEVEKVPGCVWNKIK